MSIIEQFRRILKAAPNLPVQMTTAIGLLIGAGILGYKAFEGLFANWTEDTAEFVDYRGVQERTREGKPDYFYKLHYKFIVNNQDYKVSRERYFRTLDSANRKLEEEIKIDFLPVWYSYWDPQKATMNEEDTKWYYFLYALIPVLLVLVYLRWIFLKYYELEIEK